jgi:hypothetical protein
MMIFVTYPVSVDFSYFLTSHDYIDYIARHAYLWSVMIICL